MYNIELSVKILHGLMLGRKGMIEILKMGEDAWHDASFDVDLSLIHI